MAFEFTYPSFLPIYKALKVWMTKEIHISKLKMAEKQEMQSEEGRKTILFPPLKIYLFTVLDFICINVK